MSPVGVLLAIVVLVAALFVDPIILVVLALVIAIDLIYT